MFLDYIFESKRWQKAKSMWESKDYFNALLHVLNGTPDITYPIRERDKNGKLLKRGESSYNYLLKWATEKYGHYNDLRNWKNLLWREFWHLTGACLAFIPQYASYEVLGWIGFLATWLPMVIYYSKKEFIDDPKGDGAFFPKNVIDLMMWLTPGLIFIFNKVIM